MSDTKVLRPLLPEDLVRLRDIGPPSPEAGSSMISLSPDRRQVAFQLREADPISNSYRLAIYVMEIHPGASPVMVDEGGELIRRTVAGLGGVLLETGLPTSISCLWSPDGSTVYFLKRVDGSTQIWSASADGHGSKKVTDGPADVETFALSADGKRLIYKSRRMEQPALDRLKREALLGYRYDRRFNPLFSSAPTALSTAFWNVSAIDLATGTTTPATLDERSHLEAKKSATSSSPAALSPAGRLAWTAPDQTTGDSAESELHADDPLLHAQHCEWPSCRGASLVWWQPDGHHVGFMRREGWGKSETAIYSWLPGGSAPKRLYATEDLLLDCQPVVERLLCAREQSATPRHLILLGPASGWAEIVFDPNPTFGGLRLGKIERLRWRNSFGIESFGDLVYPAPYTEGRSYPLIVVQYQSRGFLRGGTGDEFPIQAFANHGYAVLSIQRPSARDLAPGATGGKDLDRQILKDFKDRRSVLSSIETAVGILTKRGLVDPRHVGIGGISDGSSTVQFAAVNSDIFAAASVSGCCWEPWQDALVGPDTANFYHEIGWPPLATDASDFWSHMSLVKNARRVALPLLMQQSDDEYRGALASYTALKQAGKPAALYIFPGEHHVKWQPAHRLAVYERNLRWFDYWLRGIGDAREWTEEADPPTDLLPTP
ncbi:MAG TPA: Atxe2 family lasso peptide isopeptidase [Sphingobium sp.]|uniref:Atxe2 family lasso peptide isopeptidase n=1 Tax=Sphingobium sp. TaxID=1912891 RepID=UPI002ED56D88